MGSAGNTSFEEIGRIIVVNRRFAVVSHVRPDGDAIGSILGLGDALSALGKEVTVINQDGVPESLRFLPNTDRVKTVDDLPRDFEVEVAFVLDTAMPKRVGEKVHERISGANYLINIDHHISNPGYGDLSYIDPDSPATGQIIYEMIRTLKMPLTAAARENLWAAISTDTGSFQYPNTTARTFEIGAELIRDGVNVGAISQDLYESYPLRRLELLRELLNTLKISGEGKVASWTLTREAVVRFGLQPADNEGLIDLIRAIKGVIVAVFFEEMENNRVRISCRSKSPEADVSRMCEKFNGGGHRLAAGARAEGKIQEIEEQFLQTVYDGLEGKY